MPIATGHEREELEAALEVILLVSFPFRAFIFLIWCGPFSNWDWYNMLIFWLASDVFLILGVGLISVGLMFAGKRYP